MEYHPHSYIKRTNTMCDINKLHKFLHQIQCPLSFYPSNTEFNLFKTIKDSIILFLKSYPFSSCSSLTRILFQKEPNTNDKAFFSKYFIILFLYSPCDSNYLPLIFSTLRRLFSQQLYSLDEIIFFIKFNLLKRTKANDNHHIKKTMLFMHSIIGDLKENELKAFIIKTIISFLMNIIEENLQAKMEIINENIYDLFTFESIYYLLRNDTKCLINEFLEKMIIYQYNTSFHSEAIQSITINIGKKNITELPNRYLKIITNVIKKESNEYQSDPYAFYNGFYFNDNYLNEIKTEYDIITNDAYIFIFSFKLSSHFKGDCSLVSVSDKDTKKDPLTNVGLSFTIVDMELVIYTQHKKIEWKTNIKLFNEKSYTLLIVQAKSNNQKEGEMMVYVNGVQCARSPMVFLPEKYHVIQIGRNAIDKECNFIGFFGTLMFFTKINKSLIDELLSYGSNYEHGFFEALSNESKIDNSLTSTPMPLINEDKYEMLKVIISSSWKAKYHNSKTAFYQNYLDISNMRMIDRSVSIVYAFPYKKHLTLKEFISIDGIKYLQLYCEYYLQLLTKYQNNIDNDSSLMIQILKAIEQLIQLCTIIFNKSNSKCITTHTFNKINIDNSWINTFNNKEYEAHDIMFFFGSLTELIKKTTEEQYKTLTDNYQNILPPLFLIIDNLPFTTLFNTLRLKLFYFLLDNSLHVTCAQKEVLIRKLLSFIIDYSTLISPLSLLDKLIEYNHRSDEYDKLLDALYHIFYMSNGSKPVDQFLLLMLSKLRTQSKYLIHLPTRVVRLLMDPITYIPYNNDLILSFLSNALEFISAFKSTRNTITDDDETLIQLDNEKAILMQLFRYLSFDNSKVNNFFTLLRDQSKEINFKSFKSLISINYNICNFPFLMQLIIEDNNNEDTQSDLFNSKFFDAKEYFELNERFLKKKLMFLCKIFKENIPLKSKEKCYKTLFNLFFYLTPRFSIEEVEKDKKENSDTDSSSTSFYYPKEQEKKRSFIESNNDNLSTANKTSSIISTKKHKTELYRIFHSKHIIPSIYIDYISLENKDDLNQLNHIILLHHSSPYFFQLLFMMYINTKFDKDIYLTIFIDLIHGLFSKFKPQYSNEHIFEDTKGINRINFLILFYQMSTMKKQWKLKKLEHIYIEYILLLINNAVLFSNILIVFPFSNAATLDLSKNSYQTKCHKLLFEIIIEFLINIITNTDLNETNTTGVNANIGLLKMVMLKGIDLKQQHSVLYEFSLRLLVQKIKKQPDLKDYDKIDYYYNIFNSHNKFTCYQLIPHIHYLIKFIFLIKSEYKQFNKTLSKTTTISNISNEIKDNNNNIITTTTVFNDNSASSQLSLFYKDVIAIFIKELKEMYTENKGLKIINDDNTSITQPLYDIIRKEIINSKCNIELETLIRLINDELNQKERITEENNYKLLKFEKDGKIKRENKNNNKATDELNGRLYFKTMIDTQKINPMLFSMSQNNSSAQQIVIIDNYDRVSMYKISDKDSVLFPMMNDKKVFMHISFGYYFRKVTFYNKEFCMMKERYKERFATMFNNDYFIEDLNYPTKLKNYNTKDYRRCFLKPNLRFFKKPYLHVSHSKLIETKNKKDKEEDNEYTVPSFLNKTMIAADNLLKDNNNNENNVFNCELITIEGAIFGKITFLSNYLVFKNNEPDEDVRFISDKKHNKKSDNKTNDCGRKSSNNFQSEISQRNEEEEEKEAEPHTLKTRLPFLLTSIESDVLRDISKVLIINYENIVMIIIRRFIYSLQAIELFLKNGRSYLFNMISIEKKDIVLKTITTHHHHIKIIDNPIEVFKQTGYSEQWLQGKLPTFDYLIYINFYSSRSFNDVNQYPIFPWLSMTCNKILIQRDFSFPMAAQKEEKRANIIRQIKEKSSSFANQLNSHYSTGAFTLYYLFRTDPFTTNMIKLQTGQLDNPNRMFCSFNEIFQIFEAASDNRELIPELFFFFELFLNLNYANLGIRCNKEMIHQFKFDHNTLNPIDYIIKQRKCIDSLSIKTEIHKWIDNVFGHLQLDKSKGSCNLFLKYSYQDFMNISEKSKRKQKNNIPEHIIWSKLRTKVSCVQNFGQTPMKLFNEKHPNYGHDITTLLAEISGSSSPHIITTSNTIISYNHISNDVNPFNSHNHTNEKWIHFNIFHDDTTGNIIKCCIKKIKGKTTHLLNGKTFHYYDSIKKVKNVQVNLKKLSLGFHKIKYVNRDNMIYSMKNAYELFHVGNRTYAAFVNYIDNTIKFYDIETLLPISKITNESFVTTIKCINNNNFITGHDNGKIIHWQISFNTESEIKTNTFFITQIKSIINQRTEVICITYHSNLNIILIADAEGYVYIRALESFELLNIIKPSYKPMSTLRIASIDISNYDVIYISAIDYNNNAKPIKFAYSLNGVCFSKADGLIGNIQFMTHGQLLSYGIVQDKRIFMLINPAKLTEVIYELKHEINDDVLQFYYMKDKGIIIYLDYHGNIHEELLCNEDINHLNNDI